MIEKVFRRQAPRANNNVQIVVSADEADKFQTLAEELRSLSGIKNVYVREFAGGKGIIDIETTLKPHNILALLKEKGKLGIFNDGIANNSLKLIIS